MVDTFLIDTNTKLISTKGKEKHEKKTVLKTSDVE